MAVRTQGAVILIAAAVGVAGLAVGVFFGAPSVPIAGLVLALAAVMLVRSARTVEPEAPRGTIELRPKPRDDEGAALTKEQSPSAGTTSPARSTASTSLGTGPPQTPAESRLLQQLKEPVGIEPQQVLDAFARDVYPGASVMSAHMWLLDETTQTMRLVAAAGRETPGPEPLPVDRSTIGAAAVRGEAVMETRRSEIDSKAAEWRYCVPLSFGDVRGTAVLDLHAEDLDREALTRVSAHLRAGLSAALVLHVYRNEQVASRSLLQAADSLMGLSDAEKIDNSALSLALEMSGADSGSVMRLDDDGLMRIRASRGLSDCVVAETAVGEGDGIAGWVLATRKALVVEDLEDKGPNSRRHGIRSAMVVPIADDDGVMGVLSVGSRAFQARFSSSRLEELESLGKLLALAHRRARAATDSQELFLETVHALAYALETKDPYSRGATQRIFETAEQLGAAMGLAGAELQTLRIAALLHDVGMPAVGDAASLHDRPLTTVEWGILKTHPVIGAEILKRSAALSTAAPLVYHHHEHYDGTGYVLGLSGEQIPLGARVLSAADAYVSMTSPRAYRDALTDAQALAELTAKSGTQFDPVVVSALRDVVTGVSRQATGVEATGNNNGRPKAAAIEAREEPGA